MESPTPTEQDKPTAASVQPVPAVDTSQLFQKDPVPIMSNQKENRLARLSKKKLLVLASLLVFTFVSVGFAFANFDKSNIESTTHRSPEEKVGNSAKSSTGDDTSSDTTTNQTVQNDDITPTQSPASTSDNSTTNTSSGSNTSMSGGSDGSSSGSGGTTTTTTSTKTYDISYTNSCYSTANVSIKIGDTVKFTNNSTKNMWPASDDHPSHTIYSEFDAGSNISTGGTYSFTFTKIGSWGYHDHIKPNCSGTITVQ